MCAYCVQSWKSMSHFNIYCTVYAHTHTHNCLDRNSPNSINFNLPFHVTYSLLIIIISIISILPFNHSSTTQTCHRLVLEGACWDGLKQLFHLCDRPINPAFRIYSKQFKSLWDPTAIRKGSQDPQILQTLAKHQWWNVKPSLYWFAYSSIHRRRAKSCEIAGFAEAASSASYKHRHFESPRPWCAYTGQGHWRYFFCRIGPRHLFQQYTNQTMNPKAIQPSVPQSNLHNGRKFVCKQKNIWMNNSAPSITSHFKQASQCSVTTVPRAPRRPAPLIARWIADGRIGRIIVLCQASMFSAASAMSHWANCHLLLFSQARMVVL